MPATASGTMWAEQKKDTLTRRCTNPFCGPLARCWAGRKLCYVRHQNRHAALSLQNRDQPHGLFLAQEALLIDVLIPIKPVLGRWLLTLGYDEGGLSPRFSALAHEFLNNFWPLIAISLLLF